MQEEGDNGGRVLDMQEEDMQEELREETEPWTNRLG